MENLAHYRPEWLTYMPTPRIETSEKLVVDPSPDARVACDEITRIRQCYRVR